MFSALAFVFCVIVESSLCTCTCTLTGSQLSSKKVTLPPGYHFSSALKVLPLPVPSRNSASKDLTSKTSSTGKLLDAPDNNSALKDSNAKTTVVKSSLSKSQSQSNLTLAVDLSAGADMDFKGSSLKFSRSLEYLGSSDEPSEEVKARSKSAQPSLGVSPKPSLSERGPPAESSVNTNAPKSSLSHLSGSQALGSQGSKGKLAVAMGSKTSSTSQNILRSIDLFAQG